MPNASVKNLVPNARSLNASPNAKVSSFQTTRSGDGIIAAGTPIGLLLVLTYAENVSRGFFSDFRPNARDINI